VEKQIVLFILDGFGIGECTDAALFGDTGANTCSHLLSAYPTLQCPTLEKMGLFDPLRRMTLIPKNPHKDTPSGIHELLGVLMPAWDVFPDGFPARLLQQVETLINRPVLFGKTASGTKIIQELGFQHLETGYPIVYTSADSVFQIAAHEEVVPLATLYYDCALIRLIVNRHPLIGRVIARPFIGDSTKGFTRTANRKDFLYQVGPIPFFEHLHKHQIKLYGNHIIQDLFPQYSILPLAGHHIHDTMTTLMESFQKNKALRDGFSSLWIVDLEDFDMLYGHRRDTAGYGKALEEFDRLLSSFLPLLSQNDLCLITADHGNDPTYQMHTDHTRENVPLLGFPSTPEPGSTAPMSFVSDYLLRWLNVEE